MLDAMLAFMRDFLGDHEVTKQILERHGFGQILVTIDCAKIVRRERTARRLDNLLEGVEGISSLCCNWTEVRAFSMCTGC